MPLQKLLKAEWSGLLLVVILAIMVIGYLKPSFLTPFNIQILLAAISVNMVIALAQMLIVEQAGGRASTGYGQVLTVKPSALHQRIGLVFGSREEVELIERYHNNPPQGAREDDPSPLFATRSLFRD